MPMRRPIRRAQLISPYGVGAMIDFPGPESLIVCGLDAWFESGNNHEFMIQDEPRLAARLGVNHLRLPPDYREQSNHYDNADLKIPMLRFPLWHTCPRCGKMKKAETHWATTPMCDCITWRKGNNEIGPKMHQVRFVAACSHGHLQDFPWAEWCHWDANAGEVYLCDNPQLTLESRGSASLAGIIVKCQCGKKRSLQGAYSFTPPDERTAGESALSRMGVKCSSTRPWLAEYNGPQCNTPLRAALRGSAALYRSHIVSSIWIPPVMSANGAKQDWVDELLGCATTLSEIQSLLKSSREFTGDTIEPIIEKSWQCYMNENLDLAAEKILNYSPEILLNDSMLWSNITVQAQVDGKHKIDADWLAGFTSRKPFWDLLTQDGERLNRFLVLANERFQNDQGPVNISQQDQVHVNHGDCDNEELEETSYRYDEYRFMIRDTEVGTSETDLMLRSVPVDNYDDSVGRYFDRIAMVHKLRETRAFTGFSRLDSEGSAVLSRLERMNQLWLKTHDSGWWRVQGWLPGYIVRGEGIFLKFQSELLSEWEGGLHGDRLNGMFNSAKQAKYTAAFTPSPRLVLLHTFAHLLIQELVYQCGYSSAALRERLYCKNGENDMAGILIYTAAGDSEGTMGGLVRMGKPGNLEMVVRRALDKARWCSSDPVCINSSGQGPDNANLAACHCCALLPETSCELGNRFLDRATVIGLPDNNSYGFFKMQ